MYCFSYVLFSPLLYLTFLVSQVVKLEPGLDPVWQETITDVGAIVGTCNEATVFVFKNSLALNDMEMRFACALRGGWMVSTDFLLHDEKRAGVCFKLLRGCRVRRRIWMSDDVCASWPQLALLLRDACTWPLSKLTVIESLDDFIALKARV